MKILHVETGMHLYGGALQVAFLIPGLARQGCENILVCPLGSAIAEKLRNHADDLHVVPMKGDLDITFVPRLRAIVRRERPDVVHLHSRRGGDVLGALAARRLGLPLVMSRRVDNLEKGWMIPLKYRLYDRVITISEGIRDVLLGQGVPADKIACVPSAVDTDLYRPSTELDWFRREFGLQPGELAVGMVAQMIPRKGHRDLLAALPRVLSDQPRVRVLLFGQGPLRASLEKEVAAAGLRGHVHFAGFRDDLPRVLPNLALLVHPAHREGLGVALLQAAACGVPVVAARAGGIPEIVRNEENGLLVAPGDTTALAGALFRLCADSSLRRRLGERGREIAITDFSIDAMVGGNLAVYRSLICV
jgi:glycosyltransferase involved in cell wall biosynthesis